jgi:hypothetical protein
MGKNNTGTFTINNITYPITPQVYQSVQSYLHERENISWVTKESPHIKYGVKIGQNDEKCIKRLVTSILNESEIGEYVLETTSIKPLSNQ